MLVWFAETTLVAAILTTAVLIAGRWLPLGPSARHALWLVVLLKLVTPPVLCWPWAASVVWPMHEMAGPPSRQSDRANGQLSSQPGSPLSEDSTAPTTKSLPPARAVWANSITIGKGTICVWFVASAALAIWQFGRVVRFCRRLEWAVPAPQWLVEQAGYVAQRIGMRGTRNNRRPKSDDTAALVS